MSIQAITGAWLHMVGVVVTANYHNPSILIKVLVNSKIVPSGWKIVKTISTPAESIVRYDNGINWLVNQQRLDISKEYNVPFVDHVDDSIHDLAEACIKRLPHVPYQNIGLNCAISVPNEDPLQWMTEKFLKTKSYSKDIVMEPRFAIKTGEAILNLDFTGGIEQRDGKQVGSVFVLCNHRFAGPFKSSDDMIQVLSGWKDTSIIADMLNEVLE